MHLILTFLITGLLFVTPLWAEPFSENSLPDITVVDTSAITTPGSSVLDRQTLQSLPQGDGAITDLLKVLPGIQFSETDNSSLTGGEILPAEISISGGRIYDNNFMIDGISNNSLLDPTSTNSSSPTLVPGHSQELFLDASLIGTITVQRSNVSARYSGFSGGVIDVETRDPSGIFGGEISARTTRSEWSSFHVDRVDNEDFINSEQADQQPKFRQYYGNASVDVPLSNTMGVLMAYSKTYSQIPLQNFGETQKQYRDMENRFIKYVYRPTEKTTFRLTYLSTPYEGEYFRDGVKDSDYSIEGGGWSLYANLEHQFRFGVAEFIIGLKQSENSRTAPQNYFSYRNTDSVDWGEKFSKKGGYGNIEKEQKTLTFASHFEFEPVQTGPVQHQWISGVTVERVEGREERTEQTTNYSTWVTDDNVVCNEGDIDCISGEQFAWYQTAYPEYSAEGELTSLGTYLEDSLVWDRITLRPGVNLSYNDLNKNMDYAFRNTVFFDLFADGSSILSAGANRYYGKSLLSHAIAGERKEYTTMKRSNVLEVDNTPEEWVDKPRTSFRQIQLSDLKTPKVDEWSVGFEQDLLGGRLNLCYIDRNSEDSLSLDIMSKDENGYIYSEWTNLGNSRHKEVTVAWEREWDRHFLLVDGTWQRSFSTNEDYSDNFELEDFEDPVWYKDQVKLKTDLPRADYNRKWSANLIYRVNLEYGFSFTNITRYRSGYAAIGKTYEDDHLLPNGDEIDVFDDLSYPSSTTFDWKLEWEKTLSETQTMTVTLDVYNVFNRKLYGYDYSNNKVTYQMGRQLWVGVDYSF